MAQAKDSKAVADCTGGSASEQGRSMSADGARGLCDPQKASDAVFESEVRTMKEVRDRYRL